MHTEWIGNVFDVFVIRILRLYMKKKKVQKKWDFHDTAGF